MTPDTAALRASRELIEHTRKMWGGPYMSRTQAAILATAEAYHDAADEVERLRKAASLADSLRGDAHTMGSLAAERDASRTAHAALIAELRAEVPRAIEDKASWALYHATEDVMEAYLDAANIARAVLDRHAPTLTTTED